MYPWLKKSFENICKRADQYTLHHGLLIKGLAGIGKGDFANSLAGYLLCQTPLDGKRCMHCQGCKLFEASSHPDFHQIESDKQIGVDSIREAIAKLLSTAQLSGNKVLIIHAAHTMTESAANALLKTLEEPTKHTYLILLCDKTEGVLPTILSRCEKIMLHPPETDDCIQWLAEQGVSGLSEQYVRLYANAPLTLLEAAKDESGLNFGAFVQNLIQLQKSQLSASELAQKWVDNGEKVVTWVQFVLASQLKKDPFNESLWQAQQKTTQLSKEVVLPGVNKAVLLADVLTQVSGFNRLTLEEFEFVS